MPWDFCLLKTQSNLRWCGRFVGVFCNCSSIVKFIELILQIRDAVPICRIDRSWCPR